MYADDATIHCGCGGAKTLIGREALRVYWVDRLRRYPAFELAEPSHRAMKLLSRISQSKGLVSAVLAFNAIGQIRVLIALRPI